jgi:DNA-binding transcriptional LysR family regulator
MTDRFDWDALQSFLAVVRAGRLTAAAQQLGVNHSTLSRRITGLETALQARLFHRRPAGYSLTVQGERLLEMAQTVENTVMAAMAEIAGSSLRVAGTVRIGATEGFGTIFLAPRLGKLGRAHPDLMIQLVTMPRLLSLSKREADIAIVLARPQEGRLHARKLTDYELGLYASGEYLSGHAPIRDVSDLGRHRFIGYIEDLIYAPELDYLRLVSRDVRPFLTSSNLVAQFRAAAAGFGVCVLPCFMAATEPCLARVLPGAVSLTRSFWLTVHADMRGLARIRITSDFIAREVREARSLFLSGTSESSVTIGGAAAGSIDASGAILRDVKRPKSLRDAGCHGS